VPSTCIELVASARATPRLGARPHALGARLLWLTVLVGHGLPARAQAPISGGWVVVAASDSDAGLQQAQFRAQAIEDALRSRRANVLEPEEARARFEAAHSRAPITLGAEDIAALRARIQQATRLLALGKLREAMAATEPLRQLADRALDNLKRDLAEAQELFDICIVSATLMSNAGERRAAERHMQQCVHGFPGLKTALEYHSPEARELFARVTEQLQPGAAASLVIRSTHTEGCITRVDGIPTGPPPAALELVPSQVRVQLECGAEAGRVHPMTLESGFNQVALDPDFDRVRSDAPRLRLRTVRATTLQSRSALDALAIGRALRAEVIVLLSVTGGTTTLRRLAAYGARGPQIRWDAAVADTRALSDVAAAILAAPSPSSQRPVPRRDTHPTALRVLRLNASTAWLVPTTIVLGYSVGIASSVFALARRAEVREDSLSQSIDIDSYRQAHTFGLVGAIAGNALATGAELVGLPRRRGVPWWAWLAGGLGVAALGAAVAVAPEHACNLESRLRACTQWSEDPLLQPLLVIQSIPLLAVPLTYAISSALGDGNAASVQTDGHAAMLVVSGRF
jgi:hypothetical protein